MQLVSFAAKRRKSGRGRFSFGTKAESLARIAPLLKRARVLPLLYFTAAEWTAGREAILRRIRSSFAGPSLAVRSSALQEDGATDSMAGKFRSFLDVERDDPAAIGRAVDAVFASCPPAARNQVLVQPMLTGIAVSGVITSRVLASGAPYYVLSYDDTSGRTDTITGGVGASKTVFVFREATREDILSARVRRWVAFSKEAERLTGGMPIELEFGETRGGGLVLFQVRRISAGARGNWEAPSLERFRVMLEEAEAYFGARSERRAGLLGKRTILSEMSDWNPAEMIGTAPQALAASLYRLLVTDHVWRDARASMGYRAPAGESLMVFLGGRPYIDLRNSFNSFLPGGLDDASGERIVNAWLARVDAHPELHDKVEFEVAQTALDFCFEADHRSRYPDLLSRRAFQAYRAALRALTAGCLAPGAAGSLALSLDKVRELERRQSRRAAGAGPAAWKIHPLQGARALLEECRMLGTLPFAVIARHAFIAEALLRSAERREAFAPGRLDRFRQSLTTVASQLVSAMRSAHASAAARRKFLARFGHLRPGTYDILSPRYDERPDLFEDQRPVTQRAARPRFALAPAESRQLRGLLEEAGLDAVTPAELMRYCAAAIVGREYAKFVFSRNLSDALSLIARWGEEAGLAREELANLPIEMMLESFVRPTLTGHLSHLKAVAEHHNALGHAYHAIPLSYLIRSVHDIRVVPVHRSAPNFVTRVRVVGPVRYLDGRKGSKGLADRVVCIENADPGFDWIFVRGIAGLITKYGGANSHMAIRCAELGLPAAIGVGEQLFGRIVGAARVNLNCLDRTILPLD
jgi:glutamine kinase